MTETCTVTSSSRLERHRRKRRAKLGSSARLWKRSQERYENLDDGEGEQPQETSFDSTSTEELFHPFHDEPMVEDMDCEDFLSFAFIHEDSESADAALHVLPRPVTPDFMQFAPSDLDVSPSSPVKFISEPTPGATKHKKTLRFADDLGKPLTDVHYVETMYSIQDLKWIRAIVLLLNSKKRKFEFIHVSYNVEERTSIADILKQLPDMATDDDLKSQGYTGLCRTTEFGRELINTVAIQGYDLQRDEILVAIMKGVSGKSQLNIAQPLLENKKILRAVRRAKAQGQAVKRLESSDRIQKQGKGSRKKKQVSPLPQVVTLEKELIPDMTLPESEVENVSAVENDVAQETRGHDDGHKDKAAVSRFMNAAMFAAMAFTLSSHGRKDSKERNSRMD